MLGYCLTVGHHNLLNHIEIPPRDVMAELGKSENLVSVTNNTNESCDISHMLIPIQKQEIAWLSVSNIVGSPPFATIWSHKSLVSLLNF